MNVEKHLSATTAGRYQPASPIARGGDREELRRSCRGCRTERYELRAGSTGEVIDVDRLVHSAVDVPDGCGDGVVRVVAESRSSRLCYVDDMLLGFAWSHERSP